MSTILGRPGLAYALNISELESNSIGMVNLCDCQNAATRCDFSFALFPCSKVLTAKTFIGSFSAETQSAITCVSLSAFQQGTHQVAQKSTSTTDPRRSCNAIFFPSKVSSAKSGA